MTAIALNEALRVVIWRTKDLDQLRDQLFRLKSLPSDSPYYRLLEELQIREEWRVARQDEICADRHIISQEDTEYSLHRSVKIMCARLMRLHMSYERPTDAREHLMNITNSSDMSPLVAGKMREIDLLLTSGKRSIGALLRPCFDYSAGIFAAEVRRLGEIAERKKSSEKEVRNSLSGIDRNAVGQFEQQFKNKLTEEFRLKQALQAAEALRLKRAAKVIQNRWKRYRKGQKSIAAGNAGKWMLAFLTRKRAVKQRVFTCRKNYLVQRLRHWYPILVARFRTRSWRPYKDLAYYIGELPQCTTIQRYARGYITRKFLSHYRSFYNHRCKRLRVKAEKEKKRLWKVMWEADLEVLTHCGNFEQEKSIYEAYGISQRARFDSDWRRYDQKLKSVISKGMESSKDWIQVEGWWMNMKLGLRQLESPLAIVYERNKAALKRKAEDALSATFAAIETANEALVTGARIRLKKLKEELKGKRRREIVADRL